jgi:hypothetical protein
LSTPVRGVKANHKAKSKQKTMDEKTYASYDGQEKEPFTGPDPDKFEDPEYLEKHRVLFESDYGPANQRSKRVWLSICQKFGFEFTARVHGLDDYGMKKKLGMITFQQELKEKFRQKNLARLNS